MTEDDARGAMAALERAALAARDGELPERPHEAGSPECNFCSHHTGCWGNPPKETVIDTQDWRRRVPATAELAAAALAWKELNPVVQEAKRTLQAAVDANGGGTREAEGVLASYFIPRNGAKYDQGKLERTVPQDILRQCLKKTGTVNRSAFWVRTDRRAQEKQGESNEQDRVD